MLLKGTGKATFQSHFVHHKQKAFKYKNCVRGSFVCEEEAPINGTTQYYYTGVISGAFSLLSFPSHCAIQPRNFECLPYFSFACLVVSTSLGEVLSTMTVSLCTQPQHEARFTSSESLCIDRCHLHPFACWVSPSAVFSVQVLFGARHT